jgi:hypothetical protein
MMMKKKLMLGKRAFCRLVSDEDQLMSQCFTRMSIQMLVDRHTMS